jgi:sugar-specific transcriptional regulator TrmB
MTVEMDVLYAKMCAMGFRRNDAIVYVTLLKIGISNPTTLAKKSGIHRPRVYDSLVRLINQGYVIKDMSRKMPRYASIDPIAVFKQIDADLSRKVIIAAELKQDLAALFQNHKTEETIFYSYSKTNWSNLKTLIGGLIDSACDSVMIALAEMHIGFGYDIVIRGLSSSTLMQVLLPKDKDELISSGPYVKTYIWNPDTSLPFSLFIINDSVVIVFDGLFISYLHRPEQADKFKVVFKRLILE